MGGLRGTREYVGYALNVSKAIYSQVFLIGCITSSWVTVMNNHSNRK